VEQQSTDPHFFVRLCFVDTIVLHLRRWN